MVNILTGQGAAITPDFMIKIGDKDVTSNIHSRLISLTMTDEKEFQADSVIIQLDDSDGLVELPERGVVLSLSLGWKGSSLLPKGSFIVDEISHQGAPDTVTIKARSIDFRQKFSVQNEGSWHQKTLGEIVDDIAQRNSLKPGVDKSLASIVISHIDQTNESDTVFLTRLANRNGGIVSVKDGVLLMLKPGRGINASGNALPQRTILRRSGDSHKFSIADRTSYTGVIARWQDTKNPKQSQQVSVERKEKTQTATTAQHPNAKTVAKSQQEKADKYDQYMAGAPSKPLTLKQIFPNQAQAKQTAEARWKQLQRRTVDFAINLSMGDENLCPEMIVNVSGFKPVIDAQRWVVSKVTHTIDQSGFVTTVALQVNSESIEYVVNESGSE